MSAATTMLDRRAEMIVHMSATTLRAWTARKREKKSAMKERAAATRWRTRRTKRA
jgi:hypothetical protein